jgi:hypothetical protein
MLALCADVCSYLHQPRLASLYYRVLTHQQLSRGEYVNLKILGPGFG